MDHLSRLGGVFHAARALCALSLNYSIAFFAPQYLISSVESFSNRLNAFSCYCMGIINGSPNTMIDVSPTEAGDMGYVNPLCEQVDYSDEKINGLIQLIERTNVTDVIYFPGRFDNKKVLRILNDSNVRIHIDLHYDYEDVITESYNSLCSVFTSTSSAFFKNNCKGSFVDLKNICKSLGAKEFVLKENRGGSRYMSLVDEKTYMGKAFAVKTKHSVGVGDVFDSVFLAFSERDISFRLSISSIISSSYASTLDYDFFTNEVKSILSNGENLSLLRGNSIPWEEREKISIYIAAPDFPYVNKRPLNEVIECLKYHNFRVRLPIQENGLITENSTVEERKMCYYNDLSIMEESKLLIAVVLNNDPGMYVEMGMFIAHGKPTILYDPHYYCSNNFVVHAPDAVCRTLTDLIDDTFRILGEKNND